jgi:hypothetical protein
MDFAVKDMGRLIKQALGSSAVATLTTGAAYRQIHQIGSSQGQSMTWQIARSQRNGTIQPFTLSGVKITSWEIGSQEGELVTLSMDAMAKDSVTATALATPSYSAGNEIFHHQQLVVKIGGTASTATGLVSVAGGTVLTTVVKGVSVKGSTPYSESYGTSATVQEPLQNGLLDATIELDAEFTSRSEIYDVWRAGTAVPLQLTWTGSTISGGNYTLDIIASAAKIWNDELNVDGADIVAEKPVFKVGSDATNSALQVVLISTDTAI